MKATWFGWLGLAAILLCPMMTIAENPLSARSLVPRQALTPPQIDGVLDDEVWQSGPVMDEPWITYSPANGERLPQQTRIYLAYDPDNLYFAFYCHDSEPDKIKGVLAKRDDIFADDWIGLSLDAAGNRQGAYELFVNPLGVQGDLQLTGGTENAAPDWVWYSAGRMVADGYIVEIRLPLKSIRYHSGENRELGILFWRRIGRLAMSGAWPMIDPGQGILNSMTRVVYGRLASQRKLEVLPALTYASSWDRLAPDAWSPADDALRFGLGIKYDITSSITAEATVNPDFSQVESDALQVTVNQRFPVFYSEKRPFFQDAGNLFDLAAQTGLTNLTRAVHTRTIADPEWGVRLTGEQGRMAFGMLVAADRAPGQPWDGTTNPDLGKQASFWIGRGKFSLGGDNYAGLLFSDREFAGSGNRALAGDLSLRFGKYHQVLATLIGSVSDQSGESAALGSHVTAHYIFSEKNTWLAVMGEAASADFRMDSAFYQRTGFRSAALQFSQTFPVDPAKARWLTAVNPGLVVFFLHDTVTGLNDWQTQFSLYLQFPLQGALSFVYEPAQEGWAGHEFRKNTWFVSANLQPIKQLQLHSCLHLGQAVYYDPVDPFLGNRVQWHLNATWQPTDKVSLFGELVLNNLRHPGGERVFEENIVRTRLTYQFNRRLFVRGLVQYDSYYRRVLSDLLTSYTLVPGTVAHLGYGALYDKLTWTNARWESTRVADQFYQTRQSLFFKISYLHQF